MKSGPESDTMKKIRENEYYEDTTKLAKGVIVGGVEIFKGAWDGIGHIASGFGRGVTKIVEKKYGDDAKDLA